MLTGAAPAHAVGTPLFNQSFSRPTLGSGSQVMKPAAPGSTVANNVACLTASTSTTQLPVKGCGPSPADADGDGALRLTSAGSNLVGGALASTSIPTAHGLDISFDSFQYGGTSADGIAFVLAAVDPANPQPPANLGQVGGSLGYSAKGTSVGFSRGYLGLGIDVFGNYSNSVYQGSGCSNPAYINTSNGKVPGQVVVRGPGNGAVGYCALASTATTTGSSALALHGSTRANSGVPVRIIINPDAAPVRSAPAHGYAIEFTPIGGSVRVLSGSLPSAAGLGFPAGWLDARGVPKQLAFGWAASTGGATDVHEVRTSGVESVTPVPAFGITQSYLGSRSPNGTGTITVQPTLTSSASEAGSVSVTTTLPAGLTPTGTSSSGWTCTAAVGRVIACTAAGPFSASSSLPPLAIATLNGNATVTDATLATATSVVSADDAAPAYATSTSTVPLSATSVTSAGVGTAAQSRTVPIPTGGSVTLLGGGTATTFTDPGHGTYTLDLATGVITFAPVLGRTGAAAPATFQVTDSVGQTASATYTASVTLPAAPTAGALLSTAQAPMAQTATASIPSGGSVALIAGTRDPGHGAYSLNALTGVITFTTVLGWTGTAAPVTYRVTDAYGQTGTATYTATVTPPGTPAPGALLSTGTGTSPQTATTTIPASGSVILLDGSTPVTTLTVPGEGTYVLNPARGVIAFTPVLGFSGRATPVPYRVTDAYGQTGSATYTPQVNAPMGPSADALTSTGVGTAPQHATASVPATGSVTLLDAGGTPVTTVPVPNQGTYVLDAATGTVTFTPVFGYAGTATAVTYRVTDVYGTTAVATYTATVTAPAVPAVSPLTSTGEGTAVQSATSAIPVPPGGSVALLDATGRPATTVTVPGVGTYVLASSTGVVTFSPVLGFTGAAPAVTYRLTDAYGQTSTAGYTPSVTPPPAPTAAPLVTTGGSTEAQTGVVAIPNGGAASLVRADGAATNSVTVTSGVYTIDPATGVITFTPAKGFVGTAARVTFRVTDAYGQTTDAVYQATVTGTPVVPTATVAVEGRSVADSGSVLARCSVNTGRMAYCTVVLTARVAGSSRPVVVGRGKRVVSGASVAGAISVPVVLNAAGRRLAHRGLSVTVTATTRAAGSPVVLHDTAQARVVTGSVLVPHPVFFATDSSRLRPSDLSYLRGLRAKMAKFPVRTVRCVGYTDSRDLPSYNYELGLARARSACAVLVQGTSLRSVTVSWGERQPQASNATVTGRQLNRRTEVVLVY